MARCDEGYLCAVCGREVEVVADSDLYLRYVLGEVAAERLPKAPERHIRCNPSLGQFIVHEAFAPIAVDGPFGKAGLDPGFVALEEARVTSGYLRLLELADGEPGSILAYSSAGEAEVSAPVETPERP